MERKRSAQFRRHAASSRRVTTFAFVILLLYVLAIPAHAATVTVININDSGPGSLRQALADAHDGDTIDFDAALKGQTIALTTAELVINKSITITGPGPELLAVSRTQDAAPFRIFHVVAGLIVVIQGLTISNGSAFEFGCGGGILDEASLSLINCMVSGNSTDGTGGGICVNANATLTIDSSTLTGNYAGDYGGGIANGGMLTINNTTLSGNRGEFTAGAILNGFNGEASLTIKNSTLSGNTTQLHGGGIFNGGQSTISNSTLSGNSGMTGAIVNRLATLDIGGTILNRGESGPNISNDSGTVTSHGYNVSSDDGGGVLNGPGDQINTDPTVGQLQNNGGPTFTHALLPGSPAIDAGDPKFTPPPFYDQRGPGFWRVRNGRIDVGSFEVQTGATPTPTPTATPTITPVACFLSENFDNVTPPALPPGWTAINGINPDGVFWQTSNSGLPSPPADTAPNAAWVNDPAAISDKYLYSPPIIIDQFENASLMFRNNYSLEAGRDGGVLEVSIDGGPFQDILAAGGSFGQGGYNGTISACCGNPLAGRNAWTGSSGGFILTTVGVSFSGHTIVLRWRMGSDSSGSGEGWRVDSVMTACERPTPTSTPTTPPPTPTATFTPTSTPTPTPTLTTTPTGSPTATTTPTATVAVTPTATATFTPRTTPTPRAAPTPRPRPTPAPRP